MGYHATCDLCLRTINALFIVRIPSSLLLRPAEAALPGVVLRLPVLVVLALVRRRLPRLLQDLGPLDALLGRQQLVPRHQDQGSQRPHRPSRVPV